MATINHKNVVRLYCLCMSRQIMLVSQLVPLGSLLAYLKNHKNKISALTVINFSLQIAKVMLL